MTSVGKHTKNRRSHTPTPWKSEKGNIVPVNITKKTLNIIAYVESHGSRDGSANAAFIVRDCNAHEALVAALRDACDFVTPDRWGKGRPAWYDKACTALALAEDK